MQNLAHQLWVAWKDFPDWWNKYWGLDFKENQDFPWTEWTQGVIAPFVVTGLAPKLGCKPVRLESAGEKQKGTRADFVLMKDGKRLAYIEHENELKEVYGELKKLLASQVPLKGVITYGEIDELEELGKDMLRRLLDRKDMTEWILIGGIYDAKKHMKSERDWTAFTIINANGKPQLAIAGW